MAWGLWKWADGARESWAGDPTGPLGSQAHLPPAAKFSLGRACSCIFQSSEELTSSCPGPQDGRWKWEWGRLTMSTPGEEGLQELVSGGRSALGSFFPSFPLDSGPWGHCYNARVLPGNVLTLTGGSGHRFPEQVYGHFPTLTPGPWPPHFPGGPRLARAIARTSVQSAQMPVTEPYLSLEQVWTSPQM